MADGWIAVVIKIKEMKGYHVLMDFRSKIFQCRTVLHWPTDR